MKSKFNDFLSSQCNMFDFLPHDDILYTMSGSLAGQLRSKLVDSPTIYHAGSTTVTLGVQNER